MVVVTSYRIRPDAADEEARLMRSVFGELRANGPADLAYALFRTGNEFASVFVNLADDGADAVLKSPSFLAHGDGFAARADGRIGLQRISLRLVDSYGFRIGPP